MARFTRKQTKRKRTSLKRRKAVPRKKTTRRKAAPRKKVSSTRSSLLTGYAKALMNPATGPLVGIPQFVPIDTHRVRVKGVKTFTLAAGASNFAAVFQPRHVLSSSYNTAAVYVTGLNSGASNVSDIEASGTYFVSNNSPHAATEFMNTTATPEALPNNGDGIKGRVVAYKCTVTNTSAENIRDGVFTALHEKHHKNLAGFSTSDMQSTDNCKIVPASASGVSLLYRPVQPFEVEDWQLTPAGYRDERYIAATDAAGTAGDDTTIDTFPGFMRVDWNGGASQQSFMITVDAIVEFAGETITQLSRPPHLGGGAKADPKDLPVIKSHIERLEGTNKIAIDKRDLKASIAGTITKFVAGFSGLYPHVMDSVAVTEPLEMHQDAALTKGGYVAEETNGSIPAIQEMIDNSPEYLGLKDFKPIATGGSDGRAVAYMNTKTGEVTIAFGGTSNKDVTTAINDWGINMNNAELGTNAQVGFGTLQDTKAFKQNAEFVEQIESMNLTTKPFRVTGHSQGGSMAIETAKIRPTASCNVFNPGVSPRGVRLHPDAGEVTIYRTHTDPVSAMGANEAGGNIKTVNVGLKTSTREVIGGHELGQFTHANGAVKATEEGVEVMRLTKAASFSQVAGHVLGKGLVALEAGYDAYEYDGDIGEKTAVLAADAAVGGAELAAFAAATPYALAAGPVGVAALGTAMVVDALVHGQVKHEAQQVALAVEHGVEKAAKATWKAEQTAEKAIAKVEKKVAHAIINFFHW